MKKLRTNLAVKILAIVLSLFSVFTAVLGVICIGFFVYYDFYSNSIEEIRSDLIGDMAQNEIYHAYSLFSYEGTKGADLYYSDKNIFVTITNSFGDTIYSNAQEGNTVAQVEDEITECYHAGETAYFSEEFAGQLEYAEKDAAELYDSDRVWMEEDQNPYEFEVTVNVRISIPEKMKYTDRFAILNFLILFCFRIRYTVLATTPICMALSVILLVYLYLSAGWRRGEDRPKLNFVDRIPFDLYLLALFLIGVLEILFFDDVGITRIKFSAVAIGFAAVVDYFLLLGLTMTFATRVKTGTLFRNTLLFKIFSIIWQGMKYAARHLNMIWKTVVIAGGICILQAFFMIGFCYEADVLFFIWTIETVLVIGAFLLFSVWFCQIKAGGKRIAAGDLESKIDTRRMMGDFRELSNDLNHINLGLQTAVEEKMKSERFKAELITNVSHDIKTPVTSIINYVDLLKKENLTAEPVKEYIEVLDRQSARLKKLTEDILEASKASTGNIPVNFSSCEVGVLLTQALGEFSERLEAKKIEPVFCVPEGDIEILADGRLLWRVFENLLSNVCKYAQPNTRLYLSAEGSGKQAKIVFRNISQYPLNISGEELMERFVRGDTSRSTEGSGLGLSIARSLTELQNGKFDITIDGDLFKITILFDQIGGDSLAE